MHDGTDATADLPAMSHTCTYNHRHELTRAPCQGAYASPVLSPRLNMSIYSEH